MGLNFYIQYGDKALRKDTVGYQGVSNTNLYARFYMIRLDSKEI